MIVSCSVSNQHVYSVTYWSFICHLVSSVYAIKENKKLLCTKSGVGIKIKPDELN